MTVTKSKNFIKSNDSYISDIYKIISAPTHVKSIAGDSEAVIQLSSSQIEELSQTAFEHIKARHLERNIQYETLADAKKNTFLKIAGDALYNEKTGVGTLIDPTVYTHSEIPVVLGPYEGTSIYAPGGLPATIIDKKSKAMVLQGATFKSYDKEFWDNDKITRLEEAAEVTGFNDAISDASTESFIQGGSILYPVFKKETLSSYTRKLEYLHLEKDCIDRWVSVDRWNTCIVPSYIVTAKDYLKPNSLFIPLSGLEIDTSRVAFIRPKPMPYWAALYNLGWSPSDFSGWIRAYYGYETTCLSIPVMAQQMSLLLYKMPLDSLNATIGADKVKELMRVNEEKMTQWNTLSPKAVNMVGDVEVVDRTYSGFDQFIGSMKSNLAAQCELPEPTLWHTPNKGFSDNTTESLLKQSETLLMKQSFLERSMTPCTEALIAHVFGQDSEEWEKRNLVKMSFNKPVISTEKDLAEVGARFAASVSSFVQAGVSPDIAIDLSSQFFPTVKITEEMLNKAKASYEEMLEHQENVSKSDELGRSQGNVKGKKTTTGSFTKA